MAMQCSHCRGKDMVAGFTYAQCLTCGQLTDYGGQKAEFGLDAEGKRLATEGVNDTAEYAAAQHAGSTVVPESSSKSKKEK